MQQEQSTQSTQSTQHEQQQQPQPQEQLTSFINQLPVNTPLLADELLTKYNQATNSNISKVAFGRLMHSLTKGQCGKLMKNISNITVTRKTVNKVKLTYYQRSC